MGRTTGYYDIQAARQYYLERACQMQVSAMADGAKLRILAPAVAEKTAAQFKAMPYKPKRPEWKVLLWMLDKKDTSYKELPVTSDR